MDLIKKYKYVLLVVGGIISFVLLIFVGLSEKPKVITTTTEETRGRPKVANEWNGVVPGISNYADVKSSFKGTLKSARPVYGSNTLYTYVDGPSEFVTAEVGTDSTGKIVYLRTYTPSPHEGDFNTYTSKMNLGQSDFDLYVPDTEDKAFVFLDKGVALEAIIPANETHYIRYFTPMSKDDFLSTWGSDLTPYQITDGN